MLLRSSLSSLSILITSILNSVYRLFFSILFSSFSGVFYSVLSFGLCFLVSSFWQPTLSPRFGVCFYVLGRAIYHPGLIEWPNVVGVQWPSLPCYPSWVFQVCQLCGVCTLSSCSWVLIAVSMSKVSHCHCSVWGHTALTTKWSVDGYYLCWHWRCPGATKLWIYAGCC